MRSTYKEDDVTILLKDITGLIEPMATKEREALIQSGVHYSEMLPLEYKPSEKYMKAYEDALKNYSRITASAVASVAEKIYRKKGEKAVLVSLARAGTSIGVLIKRYLKSKYGITVPHYTISIIRGRGIDKNALNYILERHSPENIQFVDGWIGKGAIQRTLDDALADFKGVDNSLAVLSDPAYIDSVYGTRDDFLIASSCLNSTVSGLMSRTFLRTDIIGETDFHGAMFYGELVDEDRTYEFIESVEKHFPEFYNCQPEDKISEKGRGMAEVCKIAEKFGISDINLVKPGIGETTRVLLRRVPWKILVSSLDDLEYLGHIYQLAEEKGVSVEVYPLECYRACGIIKNLADN